MTTQFPQNAAQMPLVANEEDVRLRDAAVALVRRGRIEGVGETLPSTDRQKVLIEYVSANPHTPLLLRHARGAAVGDALAALLTRVGHDVRREYYLNDSLSSLTLRGFVRAVEQEATRQQQSGNGSGTFSSRSVGVAHVAEVANRFRALAAVRDETAMESGEQTGAVVAAAAQEHRDLLRVFGTEFDDWFSESSLYAPVNRVAETLERLRVSGHVEERDGATWLCSTRLGDAQDRVLVRADGRDTYLAADLSYHLTKYERGFDRVMDVWDADHAGYVARTYAGLRALGQPSDRLEIVLCGAPHLLNSPAAVSSILAGPATAAADDAMGGGNAETTLRQAVERMGAEMLRVGLLSADVGAPAMLPFAGSQNPLPQLVAAHRHAQTIIGEARRGAVSLFAEVDDEEDEDIAAESASFAVLPNEAMRRAFRSVALLPEAVLLAAKTLEPVRVLRAMAVVAETFLAATSGNRQPGAILIWKLLARAVLVAIEDGLATIGAKLPADIASRNNTANSAASIL